MGSIMDDEDEITDAVIENTLNNLVREVLYSEQWKLYLQSLTYSTMHREIQSLNDRICELERKADFTDYLLHNHQLCVIKNNDGVVTDVVLKLPDSDY